MTKYIDLIDELIQLIVGELSSSHRSSYKNYVLDMVLVHLRTARSLLDDLR